MVFKVCPADVEEDDSGIHGPEHMVHHNAVMKAEALADQYPDSLVLGSDTTVALGDQVLSKPADLEEAVGMLERLGGRQHTVYTAVSLRWKAANFQCDFVEQSQVCFKPLDRATILRYFECVNPLDKAGAYGIQEGREMIIESVDGSVENVMGLPIQALEACFREHGFDFRSQL